MQNFLLQSKSAFDTEVVSRVIKSPHPRRKELGALTPQLTVLLALIEDFLPLQIPLVTPEN